MGYQSPLCYLKAQNHKLKQSKVSLSVVLSQALWNKPAVPGIYKLRQESHNFRTKLVQWTESQPRKFSEFLSQKRKNIKDSWVCSSVVEPVPSMCSVLVSIPSTGEGVGWSTFVLGWLPSSGKLFTAFLLPVLHYSHVSISLIALY